MEIDRKKWFTIFAVVFVLGFLGGLLIHTAQGVRIGDFLLRRAEGEFAWGENRFVTRRTEHGISGEYTTAFATVTVELEPENERQFRFTLPDGSTKICYVGQNDSLYSTDGNLLDDWGPVVSYASEGIKLSYGTVSGYTLCNALYRVYSDHLQRWGNAIFLIPYVLFFALGTASFLFPEAVHLFGRSWQYDKVELSVDGISAMRLGAVLMMLLALFLAFSPLFIGG